MVLAIGHLHAKGIAHRDLKLENILVDDQGYIKVIDYCLAKKIPRGEKSYEFLGTFLYMAPEMVTRQGHGQAVDWWALGIILYETLFGFTPFLGATKQERFEKILSHPLFENIDIEKLKSKRYQPSFKPVVLLNTQPDEGVGCDTYIPRGNREVVR